MPVLVIKERMRVKCDACFRGVPSLADWVAALMSPSPLLGVGSSPGCKEGSVRALSAGWALGSAHTELETSRSCQPKEQQHSHLLSGQSSLPPWLAIPASVALAGGEKAGTSLCPMPVPWQ